jgi:hypothetical protein
MFRHAPMAVVVLAAYLSGGCSSPVKTAIKMGVRVVGKVVTEEETRKQGERLFGRSPSAADGEFGSPVEVWADVGSSRQWRVYRSKLDVLDKNRTVVEVSDGAIVGIEKVESNAQKTDIPQKLIYLAKARGKTPEETETALELGPPLLTVRSQMTNELAQLYDARIIKALDRTHNCLVRYDEKDRCTDVDLIEVEAAMRGAAATMPAESSS